MRLTVHTRTQLNKKFKAQAFQKEITLWTAKARELALASYVLHVPLHIQKQLREVPQQFLIRTTSLKPTVTHSDGTEVTLSTNFCYSWTSEEAIELHDPVVAVGEKFEITSSVLFNRITKHMEDQRILYDKRQKSINEFDRLLKSCSTIKALQNQWPNIGDYLPEYAAVITDIAFLGAALRG